MSVFLLRMIKSLRVCFIRLMGPEQREAAVISTKTAGALHIVKQLRRLVHFLLSE